MATVYHTSDEQTRPLGPYEFIATPPIQLILNAIRAHCGVGGTIRPGVRRLAAWANYASAGRVSPMLDQLAADGWISYDPSTGLIMLLEEPNAAITDRDQRVENEDESPVITRRDQDDSGVITPRDHWNDSEAITPRDRDAWQQDAELEAITRRDRSAPRMDDHVLGAATENQESAAAKYNIPCSPESITPRDRPIALLLAELEKTPGPGVLERVLAARDWTPQQIRDRWEYDQERIRNSGGKLGEGVFWSALLSGQLAPQRPDPANAWQGLAPPDDDPPEESLHERARRICPDGASGHDFRFLVIQLGQEMSDDAALAALTEQQKRGTR